MQNQQMQNQQMQAQNQQMQNQQMQAQNQQMQNQQVQDQQMQQRIQDMQDQQMQDQQMQDQQMQDQQNQQHQQNQQQHDGGINDLLASTASFCDIFQDHAGFYEVSRIIVRCLTSGIHTPVDSPNNPFNIYGDDEVASMLRLEQNVRNSVSPNNRNLVVAFFHPGGVYRDVVDDLMDEYWNCADMLQN